MSDSPQPPVAPDKLKSYENPVLRKSILDISKEAAQHKATIEAEERRSVLQAFEEEYAGITPDYSNLPAKRTFLATSLTENEDEAQKESRLRRQRQKSGASYLNELKILNKKREPRDDDTGPKLERIVATVHLYGLPLNAKHSTILKLLTPFGDIQDLHLGRGTASVTFKNQQEANNAKLGIQGVYLGQGCWMQTTPQINPIHPFNARPKLVNLSRVAPPAVLSERPRSGLALDLHVVKPCSLHALNRIHGLAQGVLDHGPAFEAVVRQKRCDDPNYAFLFSTTGAEAIYYRYCLCLAFQGLSKLDSPSYLLDDNIKWYPPAEQDEVDEACSLEALSNLPALENACLLSTDSRMRLYHLLRNIGGERRSISAITAFALTHPNQIQEIVDIFATSFQPHLNWKVLMARMWAIADILYNTTLPIVNIRGYRGAFELKMPGIVCTLGNAAISMDSRLRKENFCSLVLQSLNLWHERAHFSEGVAKSLTKLFHNTLASEVEVLADSAQARDPAVVHQNLAGTAEKSTAESANHDRDSLGKTTGEQCGPTILEDASLSEKLSSGPATNMPSLNEDLDEYERQYAEKSSKDTTDMEQEAHASVAKGQTKFGTMPKIKLAFGAVKKPFKPNFPLVEKSTPVTPKEGPVSGVVEQESFGRSKRRSQAQQPSLEPQYRSPSPIRREFRASPTYEVSETEPT